MTYKEQLKHPLWLEKRLEVIKRADGKCERCENWDEQRLEVHHGVYIKGKMAWEYGNELLYCLCSECHWNVQEEMDLLYIEIGKRGLELDRIKALVNKNFKSREQKENEWQRDLLTQTYSRNSL